MTEKLLDLFYIGDYTACVQEAERLLATLTDASSRSEILELMFHACVELDQYNKAHDVAYTLVSANPSSEEAVRVAALSALLNQDAVLLRRVAPQLRGTSLQETIIHATQSIIEYDYPWPYTLGLEWWRSVQEHSVLCRTAVASLKEKDFIKGLQIAESVLGDTPNSFPFYWIALVCCTNLEQLDRFIQLWERGIALYPHYWRLYLYGGIACCIMRDFARAELLFQESSLRNPEASENWLRYGDCLHRQARYGDAVRAYKTAFRMFRTLKTPVRYAAMLHTLEWGLIPAQRRRLQWQHFVNLLGYRLLRLPLIIRHVMHVKDFVNTVERNLKVRYEIQLKRI